MQQHKILFIDRDGTLIVEPGDKQVDSLDKLQLMPDVITSLLQLKQAGFRFVMITNQDGLGTKNFTESDFLLPQNMMLNIFKTQGIEFEAIRICPHLAIDRCECRKPKIGLIADYLVEQKIDRQCSYVIGDRDTDLLFAQNIGIKAIKIDLKNNITWPIIVNHILLQDRCFSFTRKTKETSVTIEVNLDKVDQINIDTGIKFFDHMLEQLVKHGGIGASIIVKGDLDIDDHHTVEDTAITLGETLRQALGDKMGIERYGFILPMDEAATQIALDLCGRFYFQFSAEFNREKVGDLSTELVPHFFRSFAENLRMNLHIHTKGENTHHMIESMFKGVGRALRQAIAKNNQQRFSIPSTKEVL